MELTSVTDNQDGTVTATASDGTNTYTSIIGLVSTPNPANASDPANITYYLTYIQSTVPPAPTTINLEG